MLLKLTMYVKDDLSKFKLFFLMCQQLYMTINKIPFKFPELRYMYTSRVVCKYPDEG